MDTHKGRHAREPRAAPTASLTSPSRRSILSEQRSATLTRMVLPDHECPFGVRARAMLEQAGFTIDEHILSTREEVEAFKSERGLATTPLIEIDGETIGGCSDLEAWLADASA